MVRFMEVREDEKDTVVVYRDAWDEGDELGDEYVAEVLAAEKRKAAESDGAGPLTKRQVVIEVPPVASGNQRSKSTSDGTNVNLMEKSKSVGENIEEFDMQMKDTLKYHLVSKAKQEVNVKSVGREILDTCLSLWLHNILGSSNELQKVVENEIRIKRQLIPATDVHTASIEVDGYQTSLYVVSSGYMSGYVENSPMHFLLDAGSEINVMPFRTFEKLNILIDVDADWRMGDANAQTTKLMGVCHNVSIVIGGVGVKVHIFVNQQAKYDLLLGRPWERAVRAEYQNRDDGSLWCKIRSPDGRRIVRFCAVPANHE